jgi:hypothetical protein
MQTAFDDNADHRSQREEDGTEVLKGTREAEVEERDTLDIKRGGGGGGGGGGGSRGEETPPRRDQGCKVAPMTQSPAAASGDI